MWKELGKSKEKTKRSLGVVAPAKYDHFVNHALPLQCREGVFKKKQRVGGGEVGRTERNRKNHEYSLERGGKEMKQQKGDRVGEGGGEKGKIKLPRGNS